MFADELVMYRLRCYEISWLLFLRPPRDSDADVWRSLETRVEEEEWDDKVGSSLF